MMTKLIEMLDIEFESIIDAAHYLTNDVLLDPDLEPLDHNLRGVMNYCDAHNIEYKDAPEEIIEMFRYKKKTQKSSTNLCVG